MRAPVRPGSLAAVPDNGRSLAALLRPLLSRLREQPHVGAAALALLFTYAFFVGPPAWNQNSRLALTRALVEQRAVTIDDWQVTTGDKSFRDGHFHSDKAPGVSLLSTLPYALFVLERRLTGGDLPDVRVAPLDPTLVAADALPEPEDRAPGDALVYNPAQLTALWLCRMFAVSLPTLLAGGLLYLLILGDAPMPTQAQRRRAMAVSLLWLLATPALGYGCALYGHQLTAALLISSVALVVLTAPTLARDPSPRAERGLGLLVGGLLGWAVLAEYTAAVPVAMIVAWIAWRRGWRLALWTAVGGLPWALLLAGYHQWAFGGPLKTGYDFVYLPEFAEGMAVAYGIGRPDPAVAVQLLFGSYRGLFYLSPVLLLAAWGLATRKRAADADSDPLASLRGGDLVLAAGIFAWYLGLNSAYYMWDGGASLGPRHMVPALPFLALGLAVAWDRLPWATLVLGALSCAHMVLITAAGPEAPGYGNPIWAYALPELFAADQPGTATTLGRLLGLPGPLSLLPLGLLWWLLWPFGSKTP
ncbi:hypothetical protein G6O69_16575 [Pseudenhygromyxa sp. WMMC2535]|uniref:hypothetical protein n=1 Tax=Pseudenhygromyxa sp. WMMC2535 TaxID=2712867 RepID=UPI00155547B2|nr:hypothetical protein [Pseudenhygromyxa sp. WMMC2535]NVB39459.1 hypothetical protein [Pseudenhygromyxa sp. WMMC2535]